MKKAICILWVAALAGALLATLLLPDQAFSDLENRVLASRPAFRAQDVLSGEWMDDMETWLADQFPGRTFFVRAKASLSRLMGQRCINGTYLGAEGQLFEVRQASAADEQFRKNVDYVRRFVEKQTGPVYFLPAYSAFTLYPERLPAFAQEPDERALVEALTLPGGAALVDPYDALAADRAQPLYFATDHHWTQRGAYAAYREFCAAAGLTPMDEPRRVDSAQPFYGSLFSKAPAWGIQPDRFFYYEIPVEVRVTYDDGSTSDSLYALDALNAKDQYLAFLDGNHARVDIETNAGTGRSLVMLKDSFAHALAPLLAPHYDRIVMLDLRYYNLPVSGVLGELPGAEVLLTYNPSWFAQDRNLFKLLG